jgi:small subunit ribosomal protein S17
MAEEEKDEQTEAVAAEPSEPEEVLHPKEARKRARSRQDGEAAPQRSGEERQAERVAERKAKVAARSRRRGVERQRSGEPGSGTPAAEREPGTKKLRQGIVISSKADKTITVRVESARRHPTYEKIVRRGKTLHAHDERNEAGEGDTVRIVEARPMSKTKRWRLLEVVEKAR